ncbi:hypothetical protein PENSPDRAFT_668690 [Peniophora sp. CONT]|nr:hypothetical protein PENSPDRAFT_668690 [Peniophora sp. CONT]
MSTHSAVTAADAATAPTGGHPSHETPSPSQVQPQVQSQDGLPDPVATSSDADVAEVDELAGDQQSSDQSDTQQSSDSLGDPPSDSTDGLNMLLVRALDVNMRTGSSLPGPADNAHELLARLLADAVQRGLPVEPPVGATRFAVCYLYDAALVDPDDEDVPGQRMSMVAPWRCPFFPYRRANRGCELSAVHFPTLEVLALHFDDYHPTANAHLNTRVRVTAVEPGPGEVPVHRSFVITTMASTPVV